MALSRTFIRGSRTPGKHRDDDNLYLDVPANRQRGGRWVFRYTLGGKAKTIGLGGRSRDPEEVREEATRYRKWLERGIDPRDGLAEEERQAAAALARRTTFKQVAEAFLEVRSAGWRNAKHANQWRATLAAYAYPTIGDTAVTDINTPDIFGLLTPIWATKPETAGRVRGRIEAILDFAKVEGQRSGENPASWRGNLALMLPPRSKVRAVEHHAALDWRAGRAFMQRLLQQSEMGATALLFAILTAARSGEVRLATWDEIGLDDSSGAHEGRAHTPCTVVRAGVGGSRPGEGQPRGRAVGLSGNEHPSGEERPAFRHDADRGAAPDGPGRSHRARIPFDIPRLGGRKHPLPQPRRGAGARARDRQCGGGRLPARAWPCCTAPRMPGR